MKSGSTLDGVSQKKLHLRTFEPRKEQQRLKGTIKLEKPAEISELKRTELQTTNAENKTKKLALPLFGALKRGSKFKSKTATVGKLPLKCTELPPALMQLKDEPEVEEEEEEEEEEEKAKEEHEERVEDGGIRLPQEKEPELEAAVELLSAPSEPSCSKEPKSHEIISQFSHMEQSKDYQEMGKIMLSCEYPSVAPENEYKKDRDELKKKKSPGPGKFPPILSSKYPEDDPDYCVCVPPEG